jgi:tetratricopeptide (TPR) repeat protein
MKRRDAAPALGANPNFGRLTPPFHCLPRGGAVSKMLPMNLRAVVLSLAMTLWGTSAVFSQDGASAPANPPAPPAPQPPATGTLDANGWCASGVTFYKANKTTQAIHAFQEAIKLDHNHADAWYYLGFAYARLERYGDAVQCFLQTAQIKPDNPDIWFNLAEARGRLRQWDGAIAAYREALRIRPDFAEAWYGIGHVCSQTGRHGDAAAAYERAVTIRNNFPEALYNLAITYAGLGRPDRAWATQRQLQKFDARAAADLGVRLQKTAAPAQNPARPR